MAYLGLQKDASKGIEHAFVLHNWMVDHCTSVGKEETADLYMLADDAGVNDTNIQEDEILTMFRSSRASVDQESAICQLFYSGHGTNFAVEAQALRNRELPLRVNTCACAMQS
jgi:hypothetical protein